MLPSKNITKYIALVFFVMGVGYYGYIFLTKTSEDSISKKASGFITAEKVTSDFLIDENQANHRYREQLIKITGIVKKVTFLNNRNTVILHGIDNDTNVLCDMKDDQHIMVQNLVSEQKVFIKGICKGFLKDAIFTNCILIKELTDD